MATAMGLRLGNPALGADTFTKFGAVADSEAMTIGGTVNKTALALLILIVTASYVWSRGADASLGLWIGLGAIGGFVLAIATVFKPTWAPMTTPLYAAAEGLALGAISVGFDRVYPGIVSQAVFLTFGTLGALLLAYRSGMIRATENFKLGIVAATGGIAFLYVISFVLGFFGIAIPLIGFERPMGHRLQPLRRRDRGAEPGARFRFHRAGRGAARAQIHGVVRRLRPARHARVALPGNPPSAGETAGPPALSGRRAPGASFGHLTAPRRLSRIVWMFEFKRSAFVNHGRGVF